MTGHEAKIGYPNLMRCHTFINETDMLNAFLHYVFYSSSFLLISGGWGCLFDFINEDLIDGVDYLKMPW